MLICQSVFRKRDATMLDTSTDFAEDSEFQPREQIRKLPFSNSTRIRVLRLGFKIETSYMNLTNAISLEHKSSTS